MDKIILLQSVTTQFLGFFWHISYYKVGQSNFLTKCGNFYYKVHHVLQSLSDFDAKCFRYYKVWQTLSQRASGITKCGRYYKVRRNRAPERSISKLRFIPAVDSPLKFIEQSAFESHQNRSNTNILKNTWRSYVMSKKSMIDIENDL